MSNTVSKVLFTAFILALLTVPVSADIIKHETEGVVQDGRLESVYSLYYKRNRYEIKFSSVYDKGIRLGEGFFRYTGDTYSLQVGTIKDDLVYMTNLLGVKATYNNFTFTVGRVYRYRDSELRYLNPAVKLKNRNVLSLSYRFKPFRLLNQNISVEAGVRYSGRVMPTLKMYSENMHIKVMGTNIEVKVENKHFYAGYTRVNRGDLALDYETSNETYQNLYAGAWYRIGGMSASISGGYRRDSYYIAPNLNYTYKLLSVILTGEYVHSQYYNAIVSMGYRVLRANVYLQAGRRGALRDDLQDYDIYGIGINKYFSSLRLNLQAQIGIEKTDRDTKITYDITAGYTRDRMKLYLSLRAWHDMETGRYLYDSEIRGEYRISDNMTIKAYGGYSEIEGYEAGIYLSKALWSGMDRRITRNKKSIIGIVYEDSNLDGVYDSSDVLVKNVAVLVWGDRTTTDSEGRFLLFPEKASGFINIDEETGYTLADDVFYDTESKDDLIYVAVRKTYRVEIHANETGIVLKAGPSFFILRDYKAIANLPRGCYIARNLEWISDKFCVEGDSKVELRLKRK